MAARAEQVEETRRRIVAATVNLHQTLGLRDTTVAAIANAAGVTRLTVYRHFPEPRDLFPACSAHWRASQRLPDPDGWAAVPGPSERLHVGLTDLYRHYREGQSMLRHVHAELDVLPDELRQGIAAINHRYRSVLLDGFPERDRTPLVRAAVGHAVSFWTWHSLAVDEGLTNEEAVELISLLILAIPPSGGPG